MDSQKYLFFSNTHMNEPEEYPKGCGQNQLGDVL